MFRRLANLIKGFFGLFVGGLEKKNPLALLEVEKENLRKQISQFNQALATHAALVERLIAQVRKLDAEEKKLRAKTKALLQTGNRDAASQSAFKLQGVDTQHDEMASQLAAAEKRYKELIRARDVSVKTARDKIEKLSRDINDMKVQKAMAELNEMAAGMVAEIGGSGDTLNRLEGIVEEERTKAAGRARVARDSMDLGDIDVKEAEQKALADMALADFAAAEGIDIEPEATEKTTAPAETEKKPQSSSGTMGPSVSE
jgi:phage shock protein A